jgi:hypothetical protein
MGEGQHGAHGRRTTPRYTQDETCHSSLCRAGALSGDTDTAGSIQKVKVR